VVLGQLGLSQNGSTDDGFSLIFQKHLFKSPEAAL